MDKHPLSPRPESHLINIIKTTTDHHPNFTLLLGAGASVTSGIKPASTMIEVWRKQHFEHYGDKTKSEKEHFQQYHWYGTSEEYAHLFEALYDQPSQRREYVESCVDTAFPSWGYIYLV